jgi:nucleotide-binding universal stress UspA family protein
MTLKGADGISILPRNVTFGPARQLGLPSGFKNQRFPFRQEYAMDQEAFTGKIVVGVDGSRASIEALKKARNIAVPLGAQVVAMACWSFPQVYGGYVAMGVEDYEKEAQGILEESLSRAFGPVVPEDVTSRLLCGPPRDLLIDASRDADMVVVGRRGHGGSAGLLLGSVSSACVAHAHCPVLVVRAPEEG